MKRRKKKIPANMFHYFLSVSRSTCRTKLDSFEYELNWLNLWCGCEMGSSSVCCRECEDRMDVAAIRDTVQKEWFRPVDLSESWLCNLQIQIS